MALIEVADGRILDVSVTGPDDAMPLLFHHGTPGSGVPFHFLLRAAGERGLRLVTYSRPGYGGSSPLSGRSVVDAVDDVRAILDYVNAPRCLVAGWSGGGPHALATAAVLPQRVAGALVIAAVAPFSAAGLDFLAGMGEDNVEEFGRAVQGEAPLREYLTEAAAGLADADPHVLAEQMRSLLPPVDVDALSEEFGEDLAANFAEALRSGIEGWLEDDLAFVAPWGFDLADITVPVFLWQGELDLMVPFAHGRWLAEHVPGVIAHLEDGQGHLSVALGGVDRMLSELMTTL